MTNTTNQTIVAVVSNNTAKEAVIKLSNFTISELKEAASVLGFKVTDKKKSDVITSVIEALSSVKVEGKTDYKEASYARLKSTVLDLPVGKLEDFGTTDEHKAIFESQYNINKKIISDSVNKITVIDNIVIYDSRYASFSKGDFSQAIIGEITVRVTEEGMISYPVLSKINGKWIATDIDVAEQGLNLVAIGMNGKRNYSNFVTATSPFKHRINPSAVKDGITEGIIIAPIYEVNGEIVVKFPKNKGKNGNYYDAVKVVNPSTGKLSGQMVEHLTAALTQAVRLCIGEAKFKNVKNNVLRDGSSCTSLKRYFSADELELQEENDGSSVNVYQKSSIMEVSKVGQILPSYVCGVTGEMLDLEAVTFVNEQSRKITESVKTETSKGDSHYYRSVSDNEMELSGEIVNKKDYIEQEVMKKCVDCPLFQECGSLSKSQIAKNAQEAKEKGSTFVNTKMNESMKPETVLPITYADNKEFYAYPQEVESNVEKLFALKTKSNILVVLDQEFTDMIEDEVVEQEFDEVKVQMTQLISMSYKTAFSFNKYTKEEASRRFEAVLDFADGIDGNHASYKLKEESAIKALAYLENAYDEYMESEDKIVSDFGDFFVGIEEALNDTVGYSFDNVSVESSLELEYLDAVTREDDGELFFTQEARSISRMFNESFNTRIDEFIYDSEGDTHKLVLIFDSLNTDDSSVVNNYKDAVLAAANSLLLQAVSNVVYQLNTVGDSDVSAFNPILQEYILERLYAAK